MDRPQIDQEPDDEALRVFIDDEGAMTLLLPASEGGEQQYFTPAQTALIGRVLFATHRLRSSHGL